MSALPTFEIRGIREQLPAGEHVLWQGTPDWRSLARTAFHVRKLAVYFAAMLGLRIAFLLENGVPWGSAIGSSSDLALLAVCTLGTLYAIAWLSARTTSYAVTDRRVVLKVGIAMPVIVNLPLRDIEAAALKTFADGSGDLPLQLKGDVRLAYAVLWPHARRWHFRHPQPMLRAVPDAASVARTLAGALAAACQMPVQWTGHQVEPRDSEPMREPMREPMCEPRREPTREPARLPIAA